MYPAVLCASCIGNRFMAKTSFSSTFSSTVLVYLSYFTA